MARKTTQQSSVMLVAALLLNGVAALAQQRQPSESALTVRDIMAEPSIAGMRPDGEKLAPDGVMCAYLWSAEGREPRDLYVVPTAAGGAARMLARAVDEPAQQQQQSSVTTSAPPPRDEAATTATTDRNREARVMQRDAANTTNQLRGESISGVEWSPDSRRLLFTKGGDIFAVNADGRSAPRRLTRTPQPETNARWLGDGQRILYQASGNLFVTKVDEAMLVQLTGETSGSQPSARTILSAIASDDGARVAYVVADTSKQRALVVPSYTGEFVSAGTVRRGWSEQHIEVVETSGEAERGLKVKLPAAEQGSYIRGVRWLLNGSAFVIDRIDRDTKRRQLFLAPAALSNARSTKQANDDQAEAQLIDEEQDPKWVASLSRIVEPSPKGDQLLFASERDGYNHLYLVSFESLKNHAARTSRNLDVKQLTRGAWEVNWATWLPDGEHILYSSTEASVHERHFYRLHVPTGKAERLPTMTGMNVDPQLSKSGDVLLYKHSQWNMPSDLYSLPLGQATSGTAAVSPRRLTDTVPARFKNVNWARPQFTTFPAKDGKTVYARIYTPPNFSERNNRAAKKHPAIVFVHGAGYLQNAINGWNNYYREAMFHHLLVNRGYIVLDIDYRGSAGYGRAWRTDVYDFLGGLDLQDHLDGIDYVVKNYRVDPARVGMYGGSYGGFIAEMAAMRAPEKIACAAALRPVADWRHYYATNPVYTTERLGRPERNPAAYRRSSPIDYADKLTRPLLILHGMVDDNVHVIDSVRLIQKLIDLGKTRYFEVMFYPNESHAFTGAAAWTDEYERIEQFFDKHLQSSTSKP